TTATSTDGSVTTSPSGPTTSTTSSGHKSPACWPTRTSCKPNSTAAWPSCGPPTRPPPSEPASNSSSPEPPKASTGSCRPTKKTCSPSTRCGPACPSCGPNKPACEDRSPRSKPNSSTATPTSNWPRTSKGSLPDSATRPTPPPSSHANKYCAAWSKKSSSDPNASSSATPSRGSITPFDPPVI